MRDECDIRFVGVRRGYKAINGGAHVRCIEEEELKRAQGDGRYRRGVGSVGSHMGRFIAI